MTEKPGRLCFIDNDEKALNIPVSHDYYVNYIRDLLTDTRGRLHRMNKLSEEINLLAKQITPMSRNSALIGHQVTGMKEAHAGDGHQSTEAISPTLNNEVYLPFVRVKRNGQKPYALSPKRIDMISAEEDRFQSNNGQSPKREEQKEITKNNLGIVITSASKPRSAFRGNKETKNPVLVGLENVRRKPTVKLKLKVVLPRCDGDGSVTCSPQESQSGRIKTTTTTGLVVKSKSVRDIPTTTTTGIVVKSRNVRDIPREILKIPRVIIQSYSHEKYFDEIRLPKIMENFHRPLQLTARTFRLPAFKKE